MIALIPARAGSKRCPGKNTRLLHGHPLIAYTIAAAQESGVFSDVVLSTEDPWTIQRLFEGGYLDDVWTHARLIEHATDDAPDILWLRDILSGRAEKDGRFGIRERIENFAILRPTSPFRTADTIRRCYQVFKDMADCGDSIRAVRKAQDHPGKMWTYAHEGAPIRPLLDEWHEYHTEPGFGKGLRVPWHSSPTQSLPTYYVQSSMLEMSWTANVEVHGTIHGRKVGPFFASDLEHVSIDTEEDWTRAEQLAREDPTRLPPIRVGAQTASTPTQ